MDDEVFCLFVVTAALLSLSVPDIAQPTFVLFSALIALGVRHPGGDRDRPPSRSDFDNASGSTG